MMNLLSIVLLGGLALAAEPVVVCADGACAYKVVYDCNGSVPNPETGKATSVKIEVAQVTSADGKTSFRARVSPAGQEEYVSTNVETGRMSHDEIAKDENVRELANMAKIDFKRVDHADVYVVDKGDDGSLATMFRFVDAAGKTLGQNGIFGWAYVGCEAPAKKKK